MLRLIVTTYLEQNSADEYVPIDHVVDGRSKRRVRLLNPYVLRLRRDAPLEAYRLKFIEVNTITYYSLYDKLSSADTEIENLLTENKTLKSTIEKLTSKVSNLEQICKSSTKKRKKSPNKSILVFTPNANATKHNDSFNGLTADETSRTVTELVQNLEHGVKAPLTQNQGIDMQTDVTVQSDVVVHTQTAVAVPTDVASEEPEKTDKTTQVEKLSTDGARKELDVPIRKQANRILIIILLFLYFMNHDTCKATDDIEKCDKNEIINIRKETDSAVLNDIKTNWNCKPQPQCRYKDNDYVGNQEREFALYKIEKPTLWFYVHVHLFEKLSTLKGNTLWNDITKGMPVSVSSISPEWSSPGMNVRYKPVDSVAREDFILPKSSLSLLVPLLEENVNAISNNMDSFDDANYLLIPTEDVLDVDKTDKSSTTLANVSSNGKKEGRRKVIVRVARALNNDMADKLTVVNQASNKFLTTRHRGTRHAQVDLEARADDNQLVHESAPGRIAIIVADNTRGSRSTLTVQVTNTGLFVARFRAQIRDCDSDLIKLSEKQEEDITSEAVSLPPRHTQRMQLRLPAFPPGENAELQHLHRSFIFLISCDGRWSPSSMSDINCFYLLNEDGESVAVRDALIKKGEHCYCVWHCDCICYGDNPRLPCREMSAARQDAAGLPARNGARYARACRYPDVTTINIAVVIIGVVGMLLFLGVLKGLLGLVWPRAGVWGLDWILEEPRPMDRYRERCLRARRVVYDTKGWPVHPDTRKKTVRVVSLPVEFILNVVFFMVTPGLVAVDTLKHLTKGKSWHASEAVGNNKANLPKRSQETLSRRHQSQGHKLFTRHQRLPRRNWMTPGAEHLATMLFPLVQHDHQRPELGPGLASESNSDQEDTAFVLMRMKESSESLAVSLQRSFE
ncbi:uncharacterized protein LOC134753772 [Cydia strobilella]|uniref:uncharacterized protein LOC134753772 n=1 Tax=Cydia strobilella TaxID=1100964 RepID=UPI0030043364